MVRRIIHPALPDDPRRRRRRAYTTGGLSPLQSSSKRLGQLNRGGRMTTPPEDRRPTMTPQLALRVAIVGSFALGLFAIIFFRLWFLQVLSGDQYVKAATVNRVRKIDIAAPRGEVLDASGTPLVDSVKTLAVQISPEDLPSPVTLDKLETLEHPPRADAIVYNRLAHVLGMPTKRTRCRLHMPPPNVFRLSPIACAVGQQVTLQSYADVTVRSGSVVTRDHAVLPGREPAAVPRRSGPEGLRHPLPRTSRWPPRCWGRSARSPRPRSRPSPIPGAARTDIVGQSGLEAQYDSFLRGKDGYQQVQVNALNQPTGDLGASSPSPATTSSCRSTPSCSGWASRRWRSR